jgi:hypothetical protein
LGGLERQRHALAVVFEGEITEAWADFNAVPDPEMKIEAESGSYPQLMPEPPVGVAGQAPLGNLAQAEADAMGYSFRDETGGRYTLSNSVLKGSPVDKLRSMAGEAGADLIIDGREIIMLPAGEARKGNAVLVNRDTGLVGYPTFTEDGVTFAMFFNPEVLFGGLVRLESVVPKATGTWKVTEVKHSISSADKWRTEIKAEYYGADRE